MNDTQTSDDVEIADRFRETARLVRERLAARSPAERDQMLQIYLAQGMTVAQRFRATASLVRFALSCQRRHGGVNVD